MFSTVWFPECILNPKPFTCVSLLDYLPVTLVCQLVSSDFGTWRALKLPAQVRH